MGSTEVGSGVGVGSCCCCCWQDTRAAAVRARIAMVFITFLSVLMCFCSVSRQPSSGYRGAQYTHFFSFGKPEILKKSKWTHVSQRFFLRDASAHRSRNFFGVMPRIGGNPACSARVEKEKSCNPVADVRCCGQHAASRYHSRRSHPTRNRSHCRYSHER